MFKFIIGLIAGFSLTIWYVVLDMRIEIDHSTTVNIVIACATLMATGIHCDSVRRQRIERVWDINKENLFNLSRSLNDLMERTKIFANRRFNIDNGLPIDSEEGTSVESFNNFGRAMNESLNVYKPLLNKSLIIAIENYQRKDKQIENSVINDYLDVYEAYELLYAEQQTLHKILNNFIKKVAAI